MNTNELLYNVEVYVQYISNLKVKSIETPAIIFRFDQFPIVLIHPKEDDTNKNSIELINFHCGKSCLFKMSELNMLKSLKTNPLQLYLADLNDKQNPKLIGYSRMNLSAQISTMNIRIDDGRSEYSIENLNILNFVGTKIGDLRLYVRISCMGNQMDHHLQMLQKQENSTKKENMTIDDFQLPIQHKPIDNKPAFNILAAMGYVDKYTDNNSAGLQLFYKKPRNENDVPAASNILIAAKEYLSNLSHDDDNNNSNNNNNKLMKKSVGIQVKPRRKRQPINTMNKKDYVNMLDLTRKQLTSSK